MSSTKSLLSAVSESGQDDIERAGYLRKLNKKLMINKKKFFVLRKESPNSPARLEYYDSEKKFKTGHDPKKSIELKKCFNINHCSDTRVKHCLALYMKDETFCVVLDSAEEANDWLKSLLEVQHGGATESGEAPKPAFECVWKVKVDKRGLGSKLNILGDYRVCLTAQSVSLLKMGCKDEAEEEKHSYEFALTSIRCCGASHTCFYMEVGRSSVTGEGQLWMEVGDQHIAAHMHSAVTCAMSGSGSGAGSSSKQGVTPPTNLTGDIAVCPVDGLGGPRPRSASYNESSKPRSIERRQTHGNDTMLSFLTGVGGPLNSSSAAASSSSSSTIAPCSSVMAPSTLAPCTTSTAAVAVPSSGVVSTAATSSSFVTCNSSVGGASVCSSSIGGVMTTSYTSSTSLLSSGGGHATMSPFSTLSEHPLGTGLGVGSRERCDSLPCAPRTRTTSEGYSGPGLAVLSAPQYHHHPHPRLLQGHHPGAHHAAGHHHQCSNFLSPSTRPHSMYARGLSHSPPIDCSPVSPVSGCCSTDSAGSSLSIDETDGGALLWSESAHHPHQNTRSLTDSLGGSTPPSRFSGMLDNGKYSGGQLLSPDDSIQGSILEENPADSIPWDSHISAEEQEYMPMDRQSVAANLSLPLTGVTSPSSTTRNLNNNKYPVKSGSPTQSLYMDMSSPLGSPPRETGLGYILMSPGADVTPQASTAPQFLKSHGVYISGGVTSANHSRGSSIAEDTPLGYVAMAPHSSSQPTSQSGSSHHRDDGYVDMMPDHSRGGSLGGSSCSLTSGTPSMTNTGDHSTHFSLEGHLEKVSSYFTPSEDEGELMCSSSCASGSLPRQDASLLGQMRQTRAYSLGSKPDSTPRRHRMEPHPSDPSSLLQCQTSRARAMSMSAHQQRSMSSRSPLQPTRHHSPIYKPGGNVSPSPIPAARARAASSQHALSSSWSGTTSASSTTVVRHESLQHTRCHPHASLEPMVGDDGNLMELDFSGMKKVSSSSADFLDIDIAGNDKNAATPMFDYAYMTVKSNGGKTKWQPVWSNKFKGSSSEQDRVSPSRGSPSRGGSDDYLNMQCGTGSRGVSQPINIATNQPAASKATTSPNMSSLLGLFSKKNSSGTPPKVPERSTSQSPFASLRRRGKKNSKKNKDKRNSMSSDDTSKATTPDGMFPFSPSTPSKSIVPEEQFAKCMLEEDGIKMADDNKDKGIDFDTESFVHPSSYTNYQPTEEPILMIRKLQQESDPKRKVSSALRPPILGQSGGRTVVIGAQDTVQSGTVFASTSKVRPRSSSSESEYVPMHPSSRRKYSEVVNASPMMKLDNSRKCSSDNILDANTSDYASMTPERCSDLRMVRDVNNDDYTMMSPLNKSEPVEPSDYALMDLGASGPKIITAGIPPRSNDLYAMMQPGFSTIPPASCIPSNFDDYTTMTPSVGNTTLKFSSMSRSPREEYSMMIPGLSKTPPKYSPGDFIRPSSDRVVLETLKEHVATTSQSSESDDYAMLAPGEDKTEKNGSMKSSSSAVPIASSTPPRKLTPSESLKSNLHPSFMEDYALMIPGDGRSSPKLLENQSLSLSSLPPVAPQQQQQQESDYALMKPGESIIEYESNFKTVQPFPVDDGGDYATLTPGKGLDKLQTKLLSVAEGDYAIMDPGKVMEDLNNAALTASSISSSLFPPRNEVRKTPSPGEENDYVLMTPAMKPPLTCHGLDAPLSLHLNNPTTLHSPLVVIPGKMRLSENHPLTTQQQQKYSPLVVNTSAHAVPENSIKSTATTSNVSASVPSSSNVSNSSATVTTIAATSTLANSSVLCQPTSTARVQVPIVPMTTSVSIIPSLSVTTSTSKSAPQSLSVTTKSPSIPSASSSKPAQSTPIHIPKTKNSTQNVSSNKAGNAGKMTTVLNKTQTVQQLQQPSCNTSQSVAAATKTQTTKQKGFNVKNTATSKNVTGIKSPGAKQQPLSSKPNLSGGGGGTRGRSTSKSPLPLQSCSTQVAGATATNTADAAATAAVQLTELNYASLDLPKFASMAPESCLEECSGAPSPLARNLSSDSSGESDVTSVGTTYYAQIDFELTQQQSKKPPT